MKRKLIAGCFLIFLLFAVMVVGKIIRNQTGTNDATSPVFSYRGDTYGYGGVVCSSISDEYSLVGKVEHVLNRSWNYGDVFGGKDSLIYHNSSFPESVYVQRDSNAQYVLFVTKELMRDMFFLDDQMYYRASFEAVQSLPLGFALRGEIQKVIRDRFPSEEFSSNIPRSIGGKIYSNPARPDMVFYEGSASGGYFEAFTSSP